MNHSTPCRLCDAATEFLFEKRIAGRIDVRYFRCANCGSMQTEVPTWLDQFYGSGPSHADAFSAERALFLQRVTYLTAKLAGLAPGDKVLDWGGGRGLVVRMLRDVGIDAHLYDRYAENVYAAVSRHDPACRYRMVTSFEVWEHLPDPKSALPEFFDAQPDWVFISTQRYQGQGEDWMYLAPTHVFFYSDAAMHLIAQRFGYRLYLFPRGLALFARAPLPPLRGALLGLLLSDKYDRLSRTAFAFAFKRKYSLSGADHARHTKAIESGEL